MSGLPAGGRRWVGWRAHGLRHLGEDLAACDLEEGARHRAFADAGQLGLELPPQRCARRRARCLVGERVQRVVELLVDQRERRPVEVGQPLLERARLVDGDEELGRERVVRALDGVLRRRPAVAEVEAADGRAEEGDLLLLPRV